MKNVLGHPADAEGWKHFDFKFPEFALDSRNIHLGLAFMGNMSLLSGFDEIDALFNFDTDTFNNAGGTSSVDDTCLSAQSSTPRRQQHSRNLELERYEQQMRSTWKEFSEENHRHFKKFNDLEQACVNPPPD
ncbi:putative transposase tnp2 [Cucumis melo var. makuwa]|uniref:Transposase tnp2 n=1 Tax=Cucumis melo var. makuwa TaxID=1194695 RepID=A0A5A7TYA6_CUCMM|nr:putative transposase tnp2 [Cucumis melo var. makuwa]TYK28355.1 putative transposase tnp2 [Cucumis melo var. makuwa]